LGSRIFGFTQELYDSTPAAEAPPEVAQFMMATFPNIFAVATSRPHDPDSVVGPGCDDQFEFEFTLDLFLDGIDRLHRMGWHSGPPALGVGCSRRGGDGLAARARRLGDLRAHRVAGYCVRAVLGVE